MLIVNGKAGTGKTMTVNILLIRALCKGLRGAIIDRAGHFQFLASLIPGAVQVRSADTQTATRYAHGTCPTPDEWSSARSITCSHCTRCCLPATTSDRGLGDLEENLLGLAIREVYARCALTGEQPRELLLQEELYRREASEARAGASDIAATLRNLALRLNNYVADGPYAYLTDWPTTVAEDSPLVIFDTRAIPDSRAAAALFVICEHVTSRIERDRAIHLDGHGPSHEWAGRYALVIDEAWKLVESRATGRWFDELSRRSRHFALWLIGISQQLSDFDNEHGRALLTNASMRLFLHQDAKELSYMHGDTRAHKRAGGGDQHAANLQARVRDSVRDERGSRERDHLDPCRTSGVLDRHVRPGRDEPYAVERYATPRRPVGRRCRLLASPQWHESNASRDGAGVMATGAIMLTSCAATPFAASRSPERCSSCSRRCSSRAESSPSSPIPRRRARPRARSTAGG